MPTVGGGLPLRVGGAGLHRGHPRTRQWPTPAVYATVPHVGTRAVGVSGSGEALLRRARIIWVLPATTALAGAVLSLASEVQRRQLVADFERSFEQHVDSVSRLVQEGARQAAEATDLVYAEAEARL